MKKADYKKQIMVVQFMHPGSEHCPDKRKKNTNTYAWNFRDHKRKYLEVSGTYVNSDDVCIKDTIYFWGEWEPTSEVRRIDSLKKSNRLPQFIHTPFLDTTFKTYPKYSVEGKDPSKIHRQNTDPFVYGEHFIYSHCKQENYKDMRNLAPGSLILLGSSSDSRTDNACFMLDTVFVIKEGFPYNSATANSALEGKIPSFYDKIMGFEDWDSTIEEICYHGVNYHEKHLFGGMYSFSPCKPGKEGQEGFERIILRHDDIEEITNKLTQGLKATESTIERNRAIWDIICKKVQEQGCFKGIAMDYNKIEA